MYIILPFTSIFSSIICAIIAKRVSKRYGFQDRNAGENHSASIRRLLKEELIWPIFAIIIIATYSIIADPQEAMQLIPTNPQTILLNFSAEREDASQTLGFIIGSVIACIGMVAIRIFRNFANNTDETDQKRKITREQRNLLMIALTLETVLTCNALVPLCYQALWLVKGLRNAILGQFINMAALFIGNLFVIISARISAFVIHEYIDSLHRIFEDSQTESLDNNSGESLLE